MAARIKLLSSTLTFEVGLFESFEEFNAAWQLPKGIPWSCLVNPAPGRRGWATVTVHADRRRPYRTLAEVSDILLETAYRAGARRMVNAPRSPTPRSKHGRR